MSSNQRPDTLMQARIIQIDEIFLHRTAGPYNRVKLRNTHNEHFTSEMASEADISAGGGLSLSPSTGPPPSASAAGQLRRRKRAN
jgi:hypothetical protein